jgi:hypothetical protein
MGKLDIPSAAHDRHSRRSFVWTSLLFIGLVSLTSLYRHISPFTTTEKHIVLKTASLTSPYGQFPLPNDAFHFIPCTSGSILPPLEDASPDKTWAKRFDPNPEHWSWGKSNSSKKVLDRKDAYSGRGIYLCGYIDVPLDYTNKSDSRIARLAVTKYQVSGLATVGSGGCGSSGGKKSERTIVIEPGGPGGSMSISSFHSEFLSRMLYILEAHETSLSYNTDTDVSQVVHPTHGVLQRM